jgi:hypothetical protein
MTYPKKKLNFKALEEYKIVLGKYVCPFEVLFLIAI